MGSSISRGASASARKFPNKADVSSRLQSAGSAAQATRSAPPPQETSQAAAASSRHLSSDKPDSIVRDSQDPDFDNMLRTLGAVRHSNNPNLPPMPSSSRTPTTQPNRIPPSYSNNNNNNNTSDPAPRPGGGGMQLPTSLLIMRARERQAFIQSTDPESYMTVFTLREVIALRQRGNKTDEEIERMLKLKRGTLGRLGNAVGPVTMRDDSVKESVDFVG